MKNYPTILIVEDEMITATSIAELLTQEDYTIIGAARDAARALLLCSQAKITPAVVICDINILGPINGIELVIQLKELYNCEIVFLTAYADNKTLLKAFTIEPVMYVVKPYNDVQLLVAVQMAFHKVFSKQKLLINKLILTDRELEIAHLIASGMSSKLICRKLNIGYETVKTHRKRMLSKNNISNFPQLIYLLTNNNS